MFSSLKILAENLKKLGLNQYDLLSIAKDDVLWSDAEFDDPDVSDAVITKYLPAEENDDYEYFVRWHGELDKPKYNEKPYFASPDIGDFDSLNAAKAAVAKAYKIRSNKR